MYLGWAHVVCALFIPEAWFGNVQTMEPIILKGVPNDRFIKVVLLNNGLLCNLFKTYKSLIHLYCTLLYLLYLSFHICNEIFTNTITIISLHMTGQFLFRTINFYFKMFFPAF